MLVVRAVMFAALVTAVGCKGDREKCEKAARNYAELAGREEFWKRAEVDIAKLPEAEQKVARQKRLAEFTNKLEGEIDFFTSQCVSANNDEQVDCMIAAKTADEVKKCADPAGAD